MMQYYIYDDPEALNFEPLALTHPVFDLRTGPFTFLERIKRTVPEGQIGLFVRHDLKAVVQADNTGWDVNPDSITDGIWLLGNVLWTSGELDRIANSGDAVYRSGEKIVAANLSRVNGMKWLQMGGPFSNSIPEVSIKDMDIEVPAYLWDLISMVNDSIEIDQNYFCNRKPAEDNYSCQLIERDSILISSSAEIKPGVCIDGSSGAVIIDDGVRIGSGVSIEGPVYIGENCIVAANTIIRPGTVAGPDCRLGGEISRSIILGKSNKSHFGFMGDSYLGEWVNLGAGTTTSNLKNNYMNVKVDINGEQVDTGRLNIGTFMGDHCKTAILSRLNTGGIMGPACMVAGDGLLPGRISPFTFYHHRENQLYVFEKFIQTATKVADRRGKQIGPEMIELLSRLCRKEKLLRSDKK